MTILVYANKELGSDSLITKGDYQYCKVDKIHPIWSNTHHSGLFIGVGGLYSDTYQVLEYFRSFLDQEMPEKPTLDAGTGGLIVDPLAERVYWFDNNLEPVEMPVDSTLTDGSGEQFCMGALKAGASVQKAIEITCSSSTTCGGDVKVWTMKEMKDFIKAKLKAKEICCLMRYRLLRAKGVK